MLRLHIRLPYIHIELKTPLTAMAISLANARRLGRHSMVQVHRIGCSLQLKKDEIFLSSKKDQIFSGTKNFFLRRNTWINGGIFLEYLDPTSHNPQPSQDPDHRTQAGTSNKNQLLDRRFRRSMSINGAQMALSQRRNMSDPYYEKLGLI